jgi:S-DNA-T family DNA segregation ATPase FtsK/SpoIIIE
MSSLARLAGKAWSVPVDAADTGRARGPRSAAATTSSGATLPEMLWQRIVWVGMLAAWLFVAAAALSFNAADPPSPMVVPVNSPVANWCGRMGAVIAYYGYESVGLGLWILLGVGAIYLSVAAAGRRVGHVWVRFLGAAIMAASFAGAQALLLPRLGPIPGLGGGLVGTVGAAELHARFATLGTMLVLGVAFSIGAIVALDAYAILAAIWTGRAMVAAAKPVGRAAGVAAVRGYERWGGGTLGRRATEGDDEAGSRRAAGVRENDVDDDESIPGQEETGGRAKKGGRPASFIEPAARKSVPKRVDAEDEDDDHLDQSQPGAITVDEDEEAEYEEDGAAEAAPAKPRKKGAGAGTAKAAPSVESPDDDADGAEASGEDEDAPQTFTAEELRAKIAKLPMRFASASRRSATDDELRDLQGSNAADVEGYRFPGLDLLEAPEQGYSAKLESYVRDQAESLERALKEYRIDGEVVGIDSGPVITLFEVRLAPGTKVAALSAISSDLARSLKAHNIRIVANTAGRDTVGIEVPNIHKEKVRLKELMTAADPGASGGLFPAGPTAAGMALPMFLGKDASGAPLVVDLAALPHCLIAGTTGSGKSVCMNTIIMSFLYTKKPNELKLVLVDPKMVELSQFKDIPHLMCPVVTDMAKAAAILEWAVGKMEERYELLAEAGCRDITSYNSLGWDELKEVFQPTTPEEEARIPRKLPYMVFVIDELADLMMTNKEVEHSIVRIAQKARAVGIHLILATQRPQANVVTGLIKSNMPGRMCFKVASGMDSRIVLDQKGGELLLGQGDMLYLSPRSSKLVRAQGTLVDEKEIRRVVRCMREVAQPSFERALINIRPGADPNGPEGDDAERNGLLAAQEDPLFDKAVEIVVETKRGSVSMLQRRLAIGYTRAARLIEMMGEAGILGGHKGTVAREVVMTLDEWHALKAQAAADARASEENPSTPVPEVLPGMASHQPYPEQVADDEALAGLEGDDEEEEEEEVDEDAEDEDDEGDDEGEESEEDEENEEDAPFEDKR